MRYTMRRLMRSLILSLLAEREFGTMDLRWTLEHREAISMSKRELVEYLDGLVNDNRIERIAKGNGWLYRIRPARRKPLGRRLEGARNA